MKPPMWRNPGTILAGCVMFAALTLAGCGESREGESFVARTASFGTWEDKRPSGSIIRHHMLVLDEPKPMLERNAVMGSYVITATGSISRKIDDVLNDRLPSMSGMKLNFAFESQASVRIERVVAEGRRELVGEKRVSFLEIVR